MTLVIAALGLALIIVPWPQLLLSGIGVLLLAFAWSLRPRIARLPPNALPREGFPATYALADGLADCFGTPRVAGVVLHDEFNASMGHIGWRNRPILAIGLPLWAILDERERLALIGHELAHEANGDLRRGLVIGSALDILTS